MLSNINFSKRDKSQTYKHEGRATEKKERVPHDCNPMWFIYVLSFDPDEQAAFFFPATSIQASTHPFTIF